MAGDTVDVGNDGYPGAYAIVLLDQDSIQINYTNAPYQQRISIPLDSPDGKATYCLRFNGVAGQFNDQYVREHTNQAEFVIPEVYELANILWVLSDHGQKNESLPKSGSYYQQDQYDSKTAAYVVDQREKLMVERRHYNRFREFCQKLAELYVSCKADEPIISVYPALLDWAQKVECYFT